MKPIFVKLFYMAPSIANFNCWFFNCHICPNWLRLLLWAIFLFQWEQKNYFTSLKLVALCLVRTQCWAICGLISTEKETASLLHTIRSASQSQGCLFTCLSGKLMTEDLNFALTTKIARHVSKLVVKDTEPLDKLKKSGGGKTCGYWFDMTTGKKKKERQCSCLTVN